MRKYIFGTLQACAVIASAACAGGCATRVDDETEIVAELPSRSTTEAEITAAIQDLISTYPVCIFVPLFRTVDAGPVNLDPAKLGLRDEHAEVAFDVMVRLGYMTRTPRPDLGARVFEFRRTGLATDAAKLGAGDTTETAIVGSGGFCIPARRILVRIQNIEYPAKDADSTYPRSLTVDFIHTEDPASVWATNPDLLEMAGGAHGKVSSGPLAGRALISRVWLRNKHPLKGAPESGELWAPQYDLAHNRWVDVRWGSVILRAPGLN